MMNFFFYNQITGNLEIEDFSFMMVDEFDALMDNERNKCADDDQGVLKLLARKELTYIWLKMDPKSPYSEYSELEAHKDALEDSELTKEEFDDPIFRAACRKYQEIIGQDRVLKMLQAINNKIDEVTVYYDSVVDFDERDTSGKPIFKLNDFCKEVDSLEKLIQGVNKLKLLYTKNQETKANIRGGETPGFMN